MTAKEKKQRRLLVERIAIATYSASAILGVSDQIVKIPGIPAIFSHYWPMILAGAMIIKAVGHHIITQIELNHMKEK